MDRSIIRQLIILLVSAGITILGVAYMLSNAYAPVRPKPMPDDFKADWIKAPGDQNYHSYFRHSFHLPAIPRRAWIKVSAFQGFEMLVNGNPFGHSMLWRPTRPFQNGLSEVAQRLDTSPPLLRLNFPREYQWDNHKDWRLPVYFDITPGVKLGANTLAFRVESRAVPARICFEGEIELWNGERVSIRSSPDTKAEPVPPGEPPLNWAKPRFEDAHWSMADVAEKPPGSTMLLFNPEIFKAHFSAQWLRSIEDSNQKILHFKTNWNLKEVPYNAWTRLLANRAYELWVNGKRVNARVTKGKMANASGEWLVNSSRRLDHNVIPELLDPDEIGFSTAGKRFMSAPHGDESENYSLESRSSIDSLEHFNNFRSMDLVEGGERLVREGNWQVNTADDYRPENRMPTTLARNRQVDAFHAYDITRLLKKGDNEIRVKLLRVDAMPPLSWQPQFALDAAVHYHDGARVVFKTDENWKEIKLLGEAEILQPVLLNGGAVHRGKKLPAMDYMGFSYNQRDKLRSWMTFGVAVLATIGGFLFLRHWPLVRSLIRPPESELERLRLMLDQRDELAKSTAWLMPPAACLFGLLVTKYAWAEREESLLFLHGDMWAAGILLTILSFYIASRQIFFPPKREDDRRSKRKKGLVGWIEWLPTTSYWSVLLCWAVLLSILVRAWHIDFQTIDDDEYASLQAILGILETGAPKFNDDIWYTRSPFYHYSAAAVAWLFGPSLWVLRLYSVAWGAATVYLVYLCGKKLFNSPWLGFGAMLLVALHPFLIYTSHIARFYQQQQFFALLTIYFFCQGFVGNKQTFKARVYCLLAYLGAILSQELSVVLGLQLALVFLLFARPRPFRDESRMFIIAALIIFIVAVDVMIFKTRTMTRLEGVSPNAEATLKPNFVSPMNYMSIFLGYSRLHLPLSMLFLLGLPLAFYEKNRHILSLYFMFFVGIVATNVLVTGVSLRYQYWLIPLWILLGLYGPRMFADSVSKVIQFGGSATRTAWLRPFICTALFFGVLIGWSPWRIPGSYEIKILNDATGAFQFVRANLREGDAVGATEPHPHGILLETGVASFDIAFPLLYDFVYKNEDGDLVDRNAQAKVISSVQDMLDACANHDRIWFVINREKFRSRNRNIRWEYPGGRAELFLRKNCTLEYESYLWSVFLWDKNRGQYAPFRHNWAIGGG